MSSGGRGSRVMLVSSRDNLLRMLVMVGILVSSVSPRKARVRWSWFLSAVLR